MIESVKVPASEGQLDAALVAPEGAGDGPWPGVVVVHEAFGLNDDVRVLAERMASAGYLAVAPDLYSWGNKARCVVSTLRELQFGTKGRALDDLRAIAEWLRGEQRCTGKVGVIGFCLGGGLAIMLAPTGAVDAAAPNYGHVPKDAEKAMAGSCPIVASFGGRDRMLRGHAARLEAALDSLGVDHDVHEYPDAGHSFFSQHGAAVRVLGAAWAVGFRRDESEDAWRRIEEFFGRHLGSEDSDPES